MDDASFIPLPDGEGNLLELVKRKKVEQNGWIAVAGITEQSADA